jgi:hypothetical protein
MSRAAELVIGRPGRGHRRLGRAEQIRRALLAAHAGEIRALDRPAPDRERRPLGAYIVLTQHVGDRVTGLSGLAVSMPVAGAIATAIAGPSLSRATWPLLGIMAGLAVLHPVVPFSLEFLALRRLTVSAFGTLMSLEPAIALLAGLLVLGQVPDAASAAGIVAVVIAGTGATRSGGRTPVPEDNRDGESQLAATG